MNEDGELHCVGERKVQSTFKKKICVYRTIAMAIYQISEMDVNENRIEEVGVFD